MELRASKRKWSDLIADYAVRPPLPVPPAKTFKPKMNLPILDSYEFAKPGEEYWKHWPVDTSCVGKSRIDGHLLKELAIQTSYRDKETL